MKTITADQVHAALHYPDFIDSLHESFAGSYTMPPRQVMLLDEASGSHDAFAMLPSWNDQVIALKAFTYFPGNQAPNRTLYSQILLFDRNCGAPLALVDGVSVTCWRTAGVSALASRFLSRPDSETLLLLGTGKLAPFLIRAHSSVRPLKQVIVWGRSKDKSAALIETMAREIPTLKFEVATDLPAACGLADIVVCATGSTEILVRGEWIKPGTHTDFLGNHHATKRECDTAMVTMSRVFVDTRVNCFKEAGEILLPVSEGVYSTDQVAGELSDLCRGRVPARQNNEEITLFKSVGCALGDLCGALIAWRVSNS
ncbi:MAG: ornithine cyclodeaminase family protein [Verrucomicrobia bacterium]|nr:ornithine cyclodeaminase family protein [Verrucomicrobiota bacterium]